MYYYGFYSNILWYIKKEITGGVILIRLVELFHVLMAIGVIVGVLMQSGKSAGMSGIIDGGASQIFGKKNRSLDEKLSLITTIVAIIFMFTSILLAVL